MVGRRGEGAFAAAPGEPGERIKVSEVAGLAEAAISSSSVRDFPAPERYLELAARVGRDRGFGDFWSHLLVAEGACEAALDPVVSVWDVAALQVIVEEAGGKFTDFAGHARLDGGSALSSNGLVHAEVIALLSGGTPWTLVSGANPRLDERFMRLALQLAQAAGDAGEVPVGAVVVKEGEAIGKGANSREVSSDPTGHAELVALRDAARALGTWRLLGTTLYATLEPCPMCAGGLVAARVSRLVFAAPDPKAGACGSLYNLCADPRLNHELSVERGVLGEEAKELLAEWFSAKRL